MMNGLRAKVRPFPDYVYLTDDLCDAATGSYAGMMFFVSFFPQIGQYLI